MPQYEINTIDEFCRRINNSGTQCDFEGLMKITSPSVFDCEIHISGDGYCSSFPIQLLQGIDDFQTSVFRSYAFAVHGKFDLRGIPKDNLWMTVKVEKGSTVLVLSCTLLAIGYLAHMFKEMTPGQRWATIILIALNFSGYLGNDWATTDKTTAIEKQRLQVEAQRLQVEASKATEKEQTERLRIEANSEVIKKAIESLAAVASENRRAVDIITTTSKNLAYGTESIVRNAEGATFIEARRRQYSQEEIEAIQKHPESQPATFRAITSTYRIVQINSEHRELWKVQLKDISTGEKISASLDPNNLFFNIEQANELFEYQKLESSLDVTIMVTERPSGNSYSIEQIAKAPN